MSIHVYTRVIHWSEGVRSLQSTSKWSPESSSRTAYRKHADFQGAWKHGACWWCWCPFRYGALGCIIGFSYERLVCPNSHTDNLRLMHLSPDRITFGKANLLCFAFWCSWFVPVSQERDECSEEIARMHALEEKYKAEIAHLAKESQVASSFRIKTLTWL